MWCVLPSNCLYSTRSPPPWLYFSKTAGGTAGGTIWSLPPPMRSNGARSAFSQSTSPLPAEWSPARAPCHRTWRKAVRSSHCPLRSLLVPSMHFAFLIHFPQISECRIVQQIPQARLPRIISRNADYIRTSEIKSFFRVDTSTRCGSIENRVRRPVTQTGNPSYPSTQCSPLTLPSSPSDPRRNSGDSTIATPHPSTKNFHSGLSAAHTSCAMGVSILWTRNATQSCRSMRSSMRPEFPLRLSLES
jgi:hypothetical protein